jgi:hypothetical protein
LTRKWGEFFKEFIDIASAIASAEVDVGVDYPITETIKHMKKLKEIIQDIDDYCEPYRCIAKQAIVDYIEEHK